MVSKINKHMHADRSMRAAAASELAITIIFQPGGGSYAHRTRACMRARFHGLANFFKFQLRTVHT